MKQRLLILFLLNGLAVSAFSDYTLTTPHFYIHAPDEVSLERTQELAQWAEGAYTALREIFPYDVAPVHIQIHNRMDQPNGSATAFGFNKINVYLHAPGPQEEFSFSRWFQSLIIHELTHVFEMDASRGYAKVLRWIFGKPPLPFTTPNFSVPFWFHEGTAVFNETLLTQDGRLNSTFYQSLFRQSVLFDHFPHISRLGYYSVNPEYPYGTSVYAYGAGLMNFLYETAEKDPQITGKLAYAQGGRFYYFFNYGAAGYFQEKLPQQADSTDFAYDVFYQRWISSETIFQKSQLNRLNQIPVTPVFPLFTDPNLNIKSLAADARGNLIYIASRLNSKAGIFLYHPESKEQTTLLRETLLDSRIVMNTSGNRFYFSLYRQKNDELYALPCVYNLETEEEEILAPLPHVKDIAPSEDESRFVGIQFLPDGSKNLILFTKESSKIEILVKNFTGGAPFFISPRQIAYVQEESGESSLIELDLASGNTSPLFRLKGKIRTPSFYQGKFYFASDQSGVENIYTFEKGSSPKAVTHLQTGGHSPAYGPSGLSFLVLHQDGYVPVLLSPEDLKSYDRLPEIETQRMKSQPYSSLAGTYEPKPYSALSYLAPYWWLPSVQYTGDRWYAGLMTSWSDPLNEHSLALSASYDFKNQDLIYLMNYQYLDRSGLALLIKAEKTLTLYKNAPKNPSGYVDYFQQELNHSLYGGYALTTLDYQFYFLAGGIFNYWKAKDKPDLFYSIYEGTLYGPSAKLAFSSKDFYLKSFRPENGISLDVTYTHFLDPKMQELSGNIGAALTLFFDTSVVVHQTGAALFGKKLPQNYFSFGGPAFSEDAPSLRGYAAGDVQGYYVYMGSMEYHIPLFYAFRGWGTKPLFLKGAYLNLFYDFAQGNTTGFDKMKIDGFLVSYGAEIGLASYLLYVIPLDFIAGYAYLDQTGESKFYFSFKIPLNLGSAGQKP